MLFAIQTSWGKYNKNELPREILSLDWVHFVGRDEKTPCTKYESLERKSHCQYMSATLTLALKRKVGLHFGPKI
jgi:hypothetical protein